MTAVGTVAAQGHVGRTWRQQGLPQPDTDGDVEIVNTIGAIDEKQGCAGRLAVVRLERTFLSAGKPWVREDIRGPPATAYRICLPKQDSTKWQVSAAMRGSTLSLRPTASTARAPPARAMVSIAWWVSRIVMPPEPKRVAGTSVTAGQ